MKFGVAQIALDNNISLNLDKIRHYAVEAAMTRADILCFPECSLTGYKRDFHEINGSEIIKGLDMLQEVAKESRIAIIVGTPYFESGKLYNAALVISTNDRFKYFKNKLTDFDEQYFAKGKGRLVFEIKGVRCGLLICRDQNYPGLAQEYAKLGTRVIFLLAAHYYLPSEAFLKLEKNRALPIARAVENELFVAKANAVGSQEDYISLGHSMIVNLTGQIMCEADEKQEKLLYHEL